jgi:nucleoside-diphosphate-sugar epimerase
MFDFSGSNVVITGASGFLGQSLAGRLASFPCHVRRVTRQPRSLPELQGPAVFENLVADITRSDAWEAIIHQADVVFHLAAQTSCYVADDDPQKDFEANVLPMIHLLQAAKRMSRELIVIFAGSATQVGVTTQWPCDESLQDHPVTAYEIHKLTAEKYLESFSARNLVRGCTLRLCNVYGPGPKTSSADRGILNLMIRKALQNHPLTVYGQGEMVRDYVYIDDVVNAFIAAAASIDSTQGRHFVLGSGQGHTIKEAIELVARRARTHANSSSQVTYIDPPPNLSPIESRHFVADTYAFHQATGWHATVDLQTGIDRTIASYLSRDLI